jgi:ABC-2 type transport system permease protein
MYPLSSIFSNFVTTAISLICLVCVWIFFKLTGISGGSALHITGYVFLSIIPMFLLLLFSTGVGLILSVFCVYFRDIEYIWDVLTQLLFYMVPIIYHVKTIQTDALVFIIKINPLYSMIELFRQCLLYGQLMSWKMLAYATATSVVTLLIGMLFFNKKSDDIIYHL